MQDTFNENFSIYKVARTNLYAAIPKQFLRFIRQCVTEYQGLSRVPADKQVKAILIHSCNNYSNEIKNNAFEQEIAINRLQFEGDEC